MTDKTAEPRGAAVPADPEGGGRRQGDRRQNQVPFEGPDRRQGDRRSGVERRAAPREGDGGEAA